MSAELPGFTEISGLGIVSCRRRLSGLCLALRHVTANDSKQTLTQSPISASLRISAGSSGAAESWTLTSEKIHFVTQF